MDDQDKKDVQDKTDVVDTGIIDAYFMQTTKLLDEITQLQQDTKGTVPHRFQSPRVTWVRSVISWFRNDSSLSD
jgi:hypothetical protein